jgi:group I intron endonuclease
MFTIYCITNTINGKKYVGQTSRNIKQRWWEHQSTARYEDTLFSRAIRKYGQDAFEIKEIDRTEDEDVASYREMFWITVLGTYRDYGYNSDIGGSGYYQPSEETLRKRSESLKKGYAEGRVTWCTRTDLDDNKIAEMYLNGLSQRAIAAQLNTSKRTIAVRLHKLNVPQRDKIDPNRVGYIFTPETRQKMRDAKLSDPLTAERCRKMTRERIERRIDGGSRSPSNRPAPTDIRV